MALLDSIEEIKRHNSAVSGDLDLINIQSFIDDAENQHLIPAIGRGQYNAILTGKSGFSEDSKEQTLLLILQKAAVNFAFGYYTNFGAVEISNAGIHVSKADKRLPASDKKVLALRRQSMTGGYAALELAVLFLEQNIDDFPTYKGSPEHHNNRSGYINSSGEFPQDLVVSAELYQRLRGIQLKMEEDYIDVVLGTSIANAVRAQILENSIEEKYVPVLQKVRRALASLTLANPLSFQLVSIDPTGTYVFSDTVGGISGNVENRTPADLDRLKITMNKLRQEANADLERLRIYLNENKGQFESYTESTASVMATINDNPDLNVYFF